MARPAPTTNGKDTTKSSNTKPDTTAERMIDRDAAKPFDILSAYLDE
jgi:hypothetical protein